MKVDCELLRTMHLDPGYALLSVQNCFTCMEMFNILDVHRGERLNDVQFLLLMRNITNLGKYDVEIIFNLLDIDHSGEIEFDEFYLVFCILIASKDAYEKEFIYRHSKSIFQLIDADGSGEISSEEFGHMGILFNFDRSAINRIFLEFDVSGDKNLDFAEFRLFTMACIDEARAQAARSKVKAYAKYQDRLLAALEPLLRRFIRTDCLPVPRDVERTTVKVRRPFIPGTRDWTLPFHSPTLQTQFTKRREGIREWIKNCAWCPCCFACCWIFCCDFCCLHHPDDNSNCKCECKCKCKCWQCWSHFLKRFCAFCCGCCHCCPGHVDHPHRQHHQEKKRRKIKQRNEHTKKLDIKVKEKVPKTPKRSSKKKGIFLLQEDGNKKNNEAADAAATESAKGDEKKKRFWLCNIL